MATVGMWGLAWGKGYISFEACSRVSTLNLFEVKSAADIEIMSQSQTRCCVPTEWVR